MTQWKFRDHCLICGGNELKIIRTEKNSMIEIDFLKPYLQKDSTLVSCKQCHMAFVQSIPNDDQFYASIYADSTRDVSIDFKYSGKLAIFDQIKTSLLKYKTAGTLLDIGTGTGAFLHQMKTHFKTTGIELGSSAREYARSIGFEVYEAPVEKLPFPSESYDVVTIIDVLEHLPDPKAAMSEIHRVLKIGGLLYIKVPNYKMQVAKQNILNFLKLSNEGMMGDYIHINHFCPRSLSTLTINHGFEILESGFSKSELWSLKWQGAPRSLFYRIFRNVIVQTTSVFLEIGSVVFRKDLGLNIYILIRKVKK